VSAGPVVVTGSGGALGRRIVARLAADGHEVVGLDVAAAPAPVESVRQLAVDIRDHAAVAAALRGARAVIHTAALHGAHAQECGPPLFFTVNVLGTVNVVSACVEHDVPRLVFTSSTSLYGASTVRRRRTAALWLDESSPVRCTDLYDHTKALGEEVCAAAARAGLDCVALRTARFFFDELVAYNVRKLNRGIDVEDAAAAHVRAALHPAPPGAGLRVYNVVARTPFQREDVRRLAVDAAEVIHERVPGAVELFERRGWSLPRTIDRVYDGARAEQELGFRPQRNFADFVHAAAAGAPARAVAAAAP
jgi:UDP-glucose 4-epimerase